MSVFVIAAWCGHTDASREMAQDIVRALQIAGIKQEVAAEMMGISPSRFAHQLSGAEPLNLFRLCQLPQEFRIAWLRCHAGRVGASIVTADERAFILACAQLGQKRVARYIPEFFQGKKAS